MTFRDIDNRHSMLVRIALVLSAAMLIAGMLAGYALAGDDSGKSGSEDAGQKESPDMVATDHFKAGLVALKNGKTDEAISEFEETIKIDPKSYNTRLMLAKLYTTRNRGADAEKMLQAAIDVEPKNPRAYDLLISLYLFRHKPEMAVKTGDEAISNGIDDKILLDLGWAYYMSGMYDKAEERYKKELDFRKDIYATYRNLGILYMATGRYDDSIKYYKKADEVSKKDKDLPFLKAITYEAMGDKKDAYEEVATFKERSPNEYTAIANRMIKRLFPHTKLPDMRPYIFSYDPALMRRLNNHTTTGNE